MPSSRVAIVFTLLSVAAAPLPSQSADDSHVLARHALTVGVEYTHESWSRYWEGTLRRDNGNIGTVTTQHLALVGAYGFRARGRHGPSISRLYGGIHYRSDIEGGKVFGAALAGFVVQFAQQDNPGP